MQPKIQFTVGALAIHYFVFFNFLASNYLPCLSFAEPDRFDNYLQPVRNIFAH